MEFKPLYYPDKIPVINPRGRGGVVTLWSKLQGSGGYMVRVEREAPQLLAPDSPLVAITNLYGNGLPQLLANLANNPQIDRLAITGTNLEQSAEGLQGFFERGVEPVNLGGNRMSRIIGTTRMIDPQLHPDMLPHLKLQRFETGDVAGIASFVNEPRDYQPVETDRRAITLAAPQFTTLPSDIWNHNIVADTPLNAWMQVLHRLDVYGIERQLEKGRRKSLFTLDVSVLNPIPESAELLAKFNQDPEQLNNYRAGILDPQQTGDQAYTYGRMIGSYWGGNTLEAVVNLFKADPQTRHALISLWDTGKHLLGTEGGVSVPCLIDLYFTNDRDKLVLSAGFRTHNAVGAWLPNLYALRALQERVSEQTGIPPGRINVRSRDIGIDPDNANAIAALALSRAHTRYPLNVHDPRGYFVVEPRGGVIAVDHYDSNGGTLLQTFTGADGKELKDKLREAGTLDNPDHAMYIGHRLAAAEQQLYGAVRDLG